MQYIIYFFLLIIGNAEKSMKVDIYPGFGWDHLRFINMSPVFDVSNFNDSDVFQSCIEMIPLHENKIETGLVLWKTRGFLGNHAFSIRVDRRVFDIKELDYKIRSLVSGMLLWKTRALL